MEIRETELDFESMKEKTLRQLRSGESLYGKDGAFAPLLKKFLEAALEAEMDGHLMSWSACVATVVTVSSTNVFAPRTAR